jgi:hypothetical protein
MLRSTDLATASLPGLFAELLAKNCVVRPFLRKHADDRTFNCPVSVSYRSLVGLRGHLEIECLVSLSANRIGGIGELERDHKVFVSCEISARHDPHITGWQM